MNSQLKHWAPGRGWVIQGKLHMRVPERTVEYRYALGLRRSGSLRECVGPCSWTPRVSTAGFSARIADVEKVMDYCFDFDA